VSDCSSCHGSTPTPCGASSTELGKPVERVTDVSEDDEAERREADEEREDPEQERAIPNVGAVVSNALRLLFLLHRLRDGGEELLVRLGLAETLEQKLGAFDLTDG
jgi:hypothetical protein